MDVLVVTLNKVNPTKVIFLTHHVDIGDLLGATKSNLRHCKSEAGETNVLIATLDRKCDVVTEELFIIERF